MSCALGDGRPVHSEGLCQPCARAFNAWVDRRRSPPWRGDLLAWAARRVRRELKRAQP